MTETTYLLNLSEGHRKYYIVELHQENKTNSVTAVWGRVGALGRVQTKLNTTSPWIARHYYQGLIRTKRNTRDYTVHKVTNNRAEMTVSLIEAVFSQL